jgi:hypothetical protein
MENTSERWDIISGIATFLFVGFLAAALFVYFYQPIEFNYQSIGFIFGFVGLFISVIALAISGLTYRRQRQHNCKT